MDHAAIIVLGTMLTVTDDCFADATPKAAKSYAGGFSSTATSWHASSRLPGINIAPEGSSINPSIPPRPITNPRLWFRTGGMVPLRAQEHSGTAGKKLLVPPRYFPGKSRDAPGPEKSNI